MRVQFTVGIAASQWSYYPTQVVEVGGDAYTLTHIPQDIAEKWLAVGHVVRVPDDEPPALETAMLAESETAVHPKRRRK